MLQTDGWRGERQNQASQPGISSASAQAHPLWLGKTSDRSLSDETRERKQPAIPPADPSSTSAASLVGLIHDTRNMIAAMDLYCDLLEEPGVLSAPFRHYATELRLVSGAGRRLLEKLAVAESLAESLIELQVATHTGNLPLPPSLPRPDSRASSRVVDGSLANPGNASNHTPANHVPANHAPAGLHRDGRRKVFQLGGTVADLAEELRANHRLLSALVGPGITVGLSISGGRRPIAMTNDDLTRVLVNLTRNAAEAMPCGGHLQIGLEEGVEYLALSFTDNGPGIPEAALETIFSPGYTTRVQLPAHDLEADFDSAPAAPAWPVQHRGLGLSIVRSLVAAAGGSAWATNSQPVPASAVLQQQGKPPDAGGEIALQNSPPVQGAVVMIEFPLLEPALAT